MTTSGETILERQLVLAAEHRRAERYDEALAVLSALYAEHPQDGRVHYQFACYHDSRGEERQAVPWYERALALGLPEPDMRGALLGLGSTLRCLGEYERAGQVLRQGMERFSQAGEFPVFLAMTLYNLGQHAEAMRLLLERVVLVNQAQDDGIARYQRAILFYHDKLDQTWT